MGSSIRPSQDCTQRQQSVRSCQMWVLLLAFFMGSSVSIRVRLGAPLAYLSVKQTYLDTARGQPPRIKSHFTVHFIEGAWSNLLRALTLRCSGGRTFSPALSKCQIKYGGGGLVWCSISFKETKKTYIKHSNRQLQHKMYVWNESRMCLTPWPLAFQGKSDGGFIIQ